MRGTPRTFSGKYLSLTTWGSGEVRCLKAYDWKTLFPHLSSYSEWLGARTCISMRLRCPTLMLVDVFLHLLLKETSFHPTIHFCSVDLTPYRIHANAFWIQPYRSMWFLHMYCTCLCVFWLASAPFYYTAHVGVLILKEADMPALMEDKLDSSGTPARHPPIAVTLIQTEKTTHSSTMHSAHTAAWKLPSSQSQQKEK